MLTKENKINEFISRLQSFNKIDRPFIEFICGEIFDYILSEENLKTMLVERSQYFLKLAKSPEFKLTTAKLVTHIQEIVKFLNNFQTDIEAFSLDYYGQTDLYQKKLDLKVKIENDSRQKNNLVDLFDFLQDYLNYDNYYPFDKQGYEEATFSLFFMEFSYHCLEQLEDFISALEIAHKYFRSTNSKEADLFFNMQEKIKTSFNHYKQVIHDRAMRDKIIEFNAYYFFSLYWRNSFSSVMLNELSSEKIDIYLKTTLLVLNELQSSNKDYQYQLEFLYTDPEIGDSILRINIYEGESLNPKANVKIKGFREGYNLQVVCLISNQPTSENEKYFSKNGFGLVDEYIREIVSPKKNSKSWKSFLNNNLRLDKTLVRLFIQIDNKGGLKINSNRINTRDLEENHINPQEFYNKVKLLHQSR